jgi:dTDP-4-dehydrorhamnose reductase
MRIFIVGASGFVGKIMFECLSREHEVYGSFYSNPLERLIHLDMTDLKAVKDILSSLKPDVIIHPAANPNVEYCEDHPMETRQVNVEGSRNLIETAREIGAKLVYFSSDYVFDGTNGPYSEDDVPNPINEYGLQKLAVEKLITKSLDNYLIIRITVVYGWERSGKNFVMGLINNLKNGSSMKVPCDQIGSPTYANNMVQAVKELIEADKTGIYHVVGTDVMDRYTFAKNVAEIFELDENLLIPVTTHQLGQKAKRPLKAGMKVDKAQKDVSIRLMTVREGLEDMKNTIIGDIL